MAGMNALTHLDLFSGVGGFAIAAQRAGFETVGFCEKEPYAQQILKERFGAVLADAQSQQAIGAGQAGLLSIPTQCCPTLHPDIFTLSGHEYFGVDLITGGFPCQPFSCAGKRRGKEDDRHLWPEMLRVIQQARPTWVLGENVAGIINMELDNCLSDLEAIGYSCWPLVIPACATDAKHRRDRVWILANANGTLAQGDECPVRGNRERTDNQQHCGRLPESRLGGVVDGLSEGLDGYHWPAEPQDTPRVAVGIPNRAARLKALGNAIVPQVAEVILREMAGLSSSSPPP